jgi:CheY-like chemotaxis protein/anti-sigma regulatory factor (Ser/Thr protein kinase)
MSDALPTHLDDPKPASLHGGNGRSAFIARLTHELRNPLAPIRMALQIMQVSEGDVATTRAARVIIDRQLKQLTRLIDDLADITQLENGSLELRCELTSLTALVNGALDIARPQLESRQNMLSIELPREPVSAYVDVGRLTHALANLLVNASKYSPLGGPVRVSAATNAKHVIVTVADEGVGIPPGLLSKIFDPFVQIDRTGGGTHDGLGIGLALAKCVAEAHGGSVTVESGGEQMGSRFMLRFPRASVSAPVPVAPPGTTATEGQKLRILVADDNRDAAQTLAMMLAFDGHDVRTAHDGLEVLAVGQLFNPDLVFLDIGMPVLDGYQTARQIRERAWGRDVHLVALTGWGQDADRAAAFDSGFQDHLVKPAAPEKLKAVIDAVRQASRRGGPPDQ